MTSTDLGFDLKKIILLFLTVKSLQSNTVRNEILHCISGNGVIEKCSFSSDISI